MDRKVLEANAEAAAQKCKAERIALTSKLKAVLDGVIANASICSFTKVRSINDSCAEIEVERPGRSYGHTFSLYFHSNFDKSPRKVELNVGTFGSFSCDDQPEANFYIAAGAFAASLRDIQEKFNAIDFTAYEQAQHKSWKAHDELQRFDASLKKAEEDKIKQAIDSRLVPGAKIKMGVYWDKTDKVDEVIKITPKRIYFKRFYNYMSRDEAMQAFTRQRDPWTFMV